MSDSSKCVRCNLQFLPAESAMSQQHGGFAVCVARLKAEVDKLRAENEELRSDLSDHGIPPR